MFGDGVFPPPFYTSIFWLKGKGCPFNAIFDLLKLIFTTKNINIQFPYY